MDWAILLLMVEAHQPVDVLEALPVWRLRELADGVQSLVREKNRVTREAAEHGARKGG